MSRNVKTLASMVEELVDRTRIVQGVVALDWTRVDFRALLMQVCEDAIGSAHAKQIQFDFEVDVDIDELYCDPNRIRQALNNIVGNAIKFTPSGGAVRLSAQLRDDAIECVVRDTGPGIAAENVRTIFEPFIRVDANGGSTGLGLGLNIARALVELHGGTIIAESEGLGRGATFRVRLPLQTANAACAPGEAAQTDV